MQKDVQEGAMNFKSTVVVYKTEFAELIHEKANPRACRANETRERLLADIRSHQFVLTFLSETGQKQQDPRQPLFAGIKELIHEVLFDSNIAGEHVREHQFRKGGIVGEKT